MLIDESGNPEHRNPFQPYEANSADVEALKACLRPLKPGELATYETLSAAIGRDVTLDRHRQLLYRALSQLLTRENLVYGCVTGKGYQRMTPEETVEQCRHALRSIRRKARLSTKKAVAGYSDTMSAEMKQRHNLFVSGMACIAYAAEERNLLRFESLCSNTQPAPLPTGVSMKLLAS